MNNLLYGIIIVQFIKVAFTGFGFAVIIPHLYHTYASPFWCAHLYEFTHNREINLTLRLQSSSV